MKNRTPAVAAVSSASVLLLSEAHATDLAEDRAGGPAVGGIGAFGV